MKKTKLGLILATIISSTTLIHATPGDIVVIDSFSDGSSFTLANTSGTASYNYLTDATGILGERRQTRTRAAGSGFYGPSALSVDTSAGTLSSYGGDTGDRYLQYGSAIGAITLTGSGPGQPIDLNLHLSLGDKILVDVASATSGGFMGINLYCGSGSLRSYNFNIDPGASGFYVINLSDFSGITQTDLDDVDGIDLTPNSAAGSAQDGLVLNEVSFSVTPVPEPSSMALMACGVAFGVPALIRARRSKKN